MIRVAVVDDHALVREGLRRLVEHAGGMQVVAEAADGAEAVEVLSTVAADVALLDVRMPKLDGVEVLRELARRGCSSRSIILTTFDDDAVVFSAIRAGAKGFLLKDVSLAQLADAITRVAEGESLILPAVTERVLSGLRRHPLPFPSAEPVEQLSRREKEVLDLMAGGYSNREIARALVLAEGTVKNHTSCILGKLGVRDRTRAVLKALELQII